MVTIMAMARGGLSSDVNGTPRFQSKTAAASDGTIAFFPSSLADVALWLGPYMSISSKISFCTRTNKVQK